MHKRPFCSEPIIHDSWQKLNATPEIALAALVKTTAEGGSEEKMPSFRNPALTVIFLELLEY